MHFGYPVLLLTVLFASQAPADEAFKPLFPRDGVPEGWAVRLWSDVSKPAPEGAQWVVEDGVTILDNDLGKETGKVRRHDGTEASALKDRPMKGVIGFQNLSRGGSPVLVRKAMIRELGEKK